VAPNALHNSGHLFDPPKCHPGTRVAVIQAIMDWVAGANEATRDKGVNWLTGAAGAGKSAIGRSVCERCTQEGTLLASFFFGSTDGTRNHSKHLAATIAYQICAISPSIRKAVSDYIEYDPLIFNKSMRTQFVSLVMDPLSSCYANRLQILPRLIVIDGIDECLDVSSQRDILETITYLTTYSYFPFCFLVCSRPESNIKNVMHGVQMSAAVFKIFLGDEYHPDEDIGLYLHDQFNLIREGHIFKSSLPVSWPSEENIRELIHKSSGQFVYASTAVRYTQSPRHVPHQRLDALLGLRPPFKDLPFAELDALYTHLLKMTDDSSLTVRILAFPAMYHKQCTYDIAKYLEIEDVEVEVVLSDLAAIVQMAPELEENNNLAHVSLLHKSFEDFLFDQHRSKDLHMYFAETRAWHILRSLQIFSG